MYKLAGAGAAIVVALAVTAGSPAAEPSKVRLTSEIRLVPKRAGTEMEPKGAEIRGKLRVTGASERDEPPAILTGGRMLMARGIALNGGDYPACELSVIDESGPRGCPKRSQTGYGRGGPPPGRDLPVGPKIEFVNGGYRRLYAYSTYFNPAFVQEPVVLRVRDARGRRWGQELRFDVPKSLQVIGGVPIAVPPFLTFTLGGKPYAPEYITTERRCPQHGFLPYRIELDYTRDGVEGTATDRGRIACR